MDPAPWPRVCQGALGSWPGSGLRARAAAWLSQVCLLLSLPRVPHPPWHTGPAALRWFSHGDPLLSPTFSPPPGVHHTNGHARAQSPPTALLRTGCEHICTAQYWSLVIPGDTWSPGGICLLPPLTPPHPSPPPFKSINPTGFLLCSRSSKGLPLPPEGDLYPSAWMPGPAGSALPPTFTSALSPPGGGAPSLPPHALPPAPPHGQLLLIRQTPATVSLPPGVLLYCL